MPVVSKAGNPLPINNYHGRHTSKFEQVDFLVMKFQHAVYWVRQPGKLVFLDLLIYLQVRIRGKKAGTFSRYST